MATLLGERNPENRLPTLRLMPALRAGFLGPSEVLRADRYVPRS
jgi:hypothetical protein